MPLKVDIAPAVSNFIEQEARFKGCPKWQALEELIEELQALRRLRTNFVQSLAISKTLQ